MMWLLVKMNKEYFKFNVLFEWDEKKFNKYEKEWGGF